MAGSAGCAPSSSPRAGHTWAPGAASPHRPPVPRVPTHLGPPPPPSRPGDKVAAQTPRPVAAEPAARSLARHRPAADEDPRRSGNATAALVAPVTASRPPPQPASAVPRGGEQPRGSPARSAWAPAPPGARACVRACLWCACLCVRVCARALPCSLAPAPKPTCPRQLHLPGPRRPRAHARRSLLVFPVAFPVTAAGLHSLRCRRQAGSKVCQEPRG